MADSKSLIESGSMRALGRKVARATKWSFVTQIASKLISPVTTLILAHLLVPEDFGVVALVTMVTSFAEIFSDAGFQKYLIQHEFKSSSEFRQCANVAFWTNLGISCAMLIGIVCFRNQIAWMLGNGSVGSALSVVALTLPLTALVSVQIAVYQRDFDFKTLFFSKIGSSSLILIVSVPLAFYSMGYWSIIIGTICSVVLQAVWLTAQSKWRPNLFYSISSLKAMLSFSSWTLLEAISIWATSWVGTFVLGQLMDSYYLGLYNAAITLVNAVISIITGAVNPIVFSSLSRMQTDKKAFASAFYIMQKYLGFAVVPIAFALLVFSNAIVELYFGSNWLEMTTFFGLYAFASAFVVIFCHVPSNAYRASGHPRYSLLAQLAFLIVLIPSLVCGALLGFSAFSYIVPFARLIGFVSVHFIICKTLMGLSPIKMMANLKWVYICVAFVSLIDVFLIQSFHLTSIQQCILLLASILVYIFCCLVIPDLRNTLFGMLNKFGLKKSINNRAEIKK